MPAFCILQMIQDILVPFIAVGIAELGDKTQLAVLALSSRTRKYLELLFGVILAFAVADGLAVLLGGFVASAIPQAYIKLASGILFVAFGIGMLKSGAEKVEKLGMKNVFLTSFTIVLVSEMGDKTQISSALFAAQFNPFLVFIGIIAALSLLSLAAVFIGKLLVSRISREKVTIVSALIFIAIGAITVFQGISSLTV